MDATDHIVAIQGIEGSFHDEAAAQYFAAGYETVPCETFKQMFTALGRRQVTHAIIAIENTVAGTILPNYTLLRDSDAIIIGEVYLAIHQNLLVLPGERLKDVTEIRSHPMAIQQCQKYLDLHPQIRLVETVDTAASAQWIARHRKRRVGAIASKRAASMYGLHVLASGIETDKRNFTRFLVITNRKTHEGPDGEAQKASLAFRLPHTRGSLAGVLTILASHGCNLTKIQSLPILGREWEYYLHIDLEFEQHAAFRRAKDEMIPHVHELKILGEYKRGEKRQ